MIGLDKKSPESKSSQALINWIKIVEQFYSEHRVRKRI
jgi:hypothetical protein